MSLGQPETVVAIQRVNRQRVEKGRARQAGLPSVKPKRRLAPGELACHQLFRNGGRRQS